jgi:hypothetical protein
MAPTYLPILRTASDPWIYLVPHPPNLEPLLLSQPLLQTTKYKLAISTTKSNKLVIKTVCFFCNNGDGKVVTFSANNDKNIIDYFPDYTLNFHGKLLRMSIPGVKSRIEAVSPYKGINNAKRGLWKSLLEEFLMKKLNFTYNVFLSWGKDGSSKGGGGTGLQLTNGTWIG